jgi:citrate lyase subunit beta/citryl-CoA lyase
LLLDLEDSVAPEQKAEARTLVVEALRGQTAGDTETAVRVNAPGTPYFEADLEAVVRGGCRLVMLPKAESAEGMHEMDERLRGLEAATGAAAGSVALLALVETPRGVVEAVALARASARLRALCFGHADFSLSMGLTEADASCGIALHARCSVVVAAKACGIAPIDTVHLAVRDEDAFRADAALGLGLGFEGKLCIHPRQVEITHEVYTPGAAEIDHAVRVVEAWERAQAEGRGVFTLDGKMIDAPLVAVQRRVLARARQAGLVRS